MKRKTSSLLDFVPEKYIKKIKFNPQQTEECLNEDIWVKIMEYLTCQEVLLTMMLVSKKIFQFAREVPLKLSVDYVTREDVFNSSNVKRISSINIGEASHIPCSIMQYIDEVRKNDIIGADKLMNSDKILGLTSLTLHSESTQGIQSIFKDNSKLKNLKQLTIHQACFYPFAYESILQNTNLASIDSITLDFFEATYKTCHDSYPVTPLAESPIFKNARSFHILNSWQFQDKEIMDLFQSPNFQNINNITLDCDNLTTKTIQTLASSKLDIHYLKITAPSDCTSDTLLEVVTVAKPFQNLHSLIILYCDPIQNTTFMDFVKKGPQRNLKTLDLCLQEVDVHVINCISRESKFRNIEHLALCDEREFVDLDSLIEWTKWKPAKVLSFFGTSCCRFISEEEFNIFLDHLELSNWRSVKNFHLDFIPLECLGRLRSILFHSTVTTDEFDEE
ncbi:hypothetical protein FDP41_000087 [Naegleria fowleri]|uniref:F-box domain-containing protein n=1 Tax=Naegleria fowleri TaxID=5763 RepID=A0A6A5CII7_NAEFO|nr:uncharacterized protein FDP41_000087 [Naegleria fowleri]KAF0985048.1 hypothetical protein FDP41_000087 [Naegleria fowleri]